MGEAPTQSLSVMLSRKSLWLEDFPKVLEDGFPLPADTPHAAALFKGTEDSTLKASIVLFDLMFQ